MEGGQVSKRNCQLRKSLYQIHCLEGGTGYQVNIGTSIIQSIVKLKKKKKG